MSTDDLVISFMGDPVRLTIVGKVDLDTGSSSMPRWSRRSATAAMCIWIFRA
jgi:hypothetical protein